MVVFVFSALCAVFVDSADDILVGCGGFVKSDVEIDYSRIEVRGRLGGLPGS